MFRHHRCAVAVLSMLSGCLATQGDADETRPCVAWTDATRPLLVGDSVRIATGLVRGSDCAVRPADEARYTWATRDTAIITVTSDGLIRGRSPGMFTAVAREDTSRLVARGFVLPRGWTLRALPESTVIHVGDTARIELRAYDPAGQVLPRVPFSIFTPEFDQLMRAPVDQPLPLLSSVRQPLVDRWSHQHELGPVPFVGLRAGVTELRGQLGERQVAVHLRIVMPDSSVR